MDLTSSTVGFTRQLQASVQFFFKDTVVYFRIRIMLLKLRHPRSYISGRHVMRISFQLVGEGNRSDGLAANLQLLIQFTPKTNTTLVTK